MPKSGTLYGQRQGKKEFGSWKIPRASNNNWCTPDDWNLKPMGGEVEGKKMTVLFSSCDAGHDKRPVQGNGRTASRELSPIPTVPTSDRNKSSFDLWKPFGEAETNAAVQGGKI